MAKEQGLFGHCFNNCAHTMRFSQKIARGMNYFFVFKNIYQLCLFAITLIRAGVAVQGPLVNDRINYGGTEFLQG